MYFCSSTGVRDAGRMVMMTGITVEFVLMKLLCGNVSEEGDMEWSLLFG